MYLLVFKEGNVITQLAIELDSNTVRQIIEDDGVISEDENLDVYKVNFTKVFELK